MSKPRRNKALAVLDGRIAHARRELELVIARQNEVNGTLTSLIEAREQVAKAYERKAKPMKQTRAAKLLDDAAAKGIRAANEQP